MIPDRTVSGTWLGGYRVDVTAGDFRMRIDEPEHVGGSDTGPQPTDLLLASVSSCFVLSLVYAARKRGVDAGSIDVDVTGTYSGPRFSRILITVAMPLPADQVDALIESARRVCYVTNTLAGGVEIVIQRAT